MTAEQDVDTIETELPAPREKKVGRKPHRRRKPRRMAAKPRAPAAPFVAPQEFAGMTERECCDACSPAGCVISGKPWCAHPFKGRQPQVMTDPGIFDRFNRAKKALKHRRIDLREP